MVKDKENYIDLEFEEMKEMWYSDESILFEIIKSLNQRETAIIHYYKSLTHRCIKANAVRYLQKNFQRYKFIPEQFNLYGSLAKYPTFPMFSFSSFVKRKQMDEFNKEYQNYMSGFDFLMDIDNEDIEIAHETAKKVKFIFDKYKIIYWTQFSGFKGFHFRVDFEDFPEWMQLLPKDKLSDTLKKFAENFQIINKFDDIDLSVFDLRRIAKTPYSVVYPYYFVAMPLTDAEFKNFNKEIVSLPNCLIRIESFKNRGLLKREGSPENFGKLVKDYLKI